MTRSTNSLPRKPQNSDDRLFHERRWADMAAERVLNPDHYVEWLSLRSTHRFLVFPGKELVIWSQSENNVTVHEVLEVKDVHASATEGLSVTLLDGDQDEFLVGHDPFRLDTGIYLWVPYYVDFQYVKRKGRDDFCVYFPMVCRMPSNPERGTPDVLHISEMRAFEDLWPDYAWED